MSLSPIAMAALAVSAFLSVVVGADVAQAQAQAATQLPTEARGQQLFLRCQTCHEVAAGRPNKVGPNLHGFIGRRAGTAPGFVYSTGMRGTDFRWTDANLDRWLQHPAQVVPGTSMAFVGLTRPEDRSTLIAWLRAHTR